MGTHIYEAYQQMNAYRWEIYDIMSDPELWPDYHPHTEGVQHVQVSPLVVGDKFCETTKTLGMKHNWVWEVASADREKGLFVFYGSDADAGLKALISYRIDEVITYNGNVLPICHVYRDFVLVTSRLRQDILLKLIGWHIQRASDKYLRNISEELSNES